VQNGKKAFVRKQKELKLCILLIKHVYVRNSIVSHKILLSVFESDTNPFDPLLACFLYSSLFSEVGHFS